jgi:hypothetical protein
MKVDALSISLNVSNSRSVWESAYLKVPGSDLS